MYVISDCKGNSPPTSLPMELQGVEPFENGHISRLDYSERQVPTALELLNEIGVDDGMMLSGEEESL
jgi:hypothetical protein